MFIKGTLTAASVARSNSWTSFIPSKVRKCIHRRLPRWFSGRHLYSQLESVTVREPSVALRSESHLHSKGSTVKRTLQLSGLYCDFNIGTGYIVYKNVQPICLQ